MKRRDVFKGLLATGILLPIAKNVSASDSKTVPKIKESGIPKPPKEMLKTIGQVHELLNSNPTIISALNREGYMIDHAQLDRLLWDVLRDA